MEEESTVPGPECLALMLCEQVIQDRQTNNLTLVNTFNTISVVFDDQQPARFGRMAVFVSLTNGHGASKGKLIIKEPQGGEVFHGEGDVGFPNPVAVVEITFDIRALPLPCAGLYEIEFWCNDALVRQRRFQVIDLKKAGAGREDGRPIDQG